MRLARSRSHSAIASAVAGMLVALIEQAGIERQAGELGQRPASHQGTPRLARKRGALADEVERVPLVTRVARDRTERPGVCACPNCTLVRRWISSLSSTSFSAWSRSPLSSIELMTEPV